MKKLLLILLCLPMIGFGQQTYVPDDNFEQELINLGYDNILDDYVLTANINTVTSLNVSNLNIADLTGIENFIALTYLGCSGNQLTTLDVSNNTLLEFLNCQGNQLSSIDVSGAVALKEFFPEDNLLTSLDLTNNVNLIEIECKNNQIQCLDVSNLLYPCELLVNNNLLEELIIDNAVVGLVATNNNLTCIQVANPSISFPYAISTDIGVVFNANCSYTNLCNSSTSIQEHTTNKELLKVTDLLGRETKGTKNEVLFYIYDDGTVEKRIVIE